MEILKEKARSYTYLTADDIEMYLSKFVFDNTDDIKVRKLLVNAFVWSKAKFMTHLPEGTPHHISYFS